LIRQHYLGHSVNAPTGRWQKNKDIHWYSRDLEDDSTQRDEEIRKVKELEAQAIASVLGYEPTTGPGSGSNAIAVPSNQDSADARRKAKEDKRRRKEEKKEEKQARRELKKISQSGAHEITDLAERPKRHPSRSRSPRYRSRERKFLEDRRARSRSRSRTPIGDRRKSRSDYDTEERGRERESDRRRRNSLTRRDQPLDRRRY